MEQPVTPTARCSSTNSTNTRDQPIGPYEEATPVLIAPSDSGYRSGVGTDTASICSEQSTGSTMGLTQDFLQDFIAFFTDTLIEKAGARQWSQYASAQFPPEYMEERLIAILRDFTIAFMPALYRSTPLPSLDTDATGQRLQQHANAILWRAIQLVRRYRPKVARYFLENCRVTPTNSVSLENRLRGLGHHLSLKEKIGLMSKHGANEHSTLEVDPDAQEDSIDEDEEFLSALSSVQGVLVSSDAFQQMAMELARVFYRDTNMEMKNVQRAVAIQFGSQPHPLARTRFFVDWDIVAFMHAQYGGIVSISSVVVLTGSAFYAQVTTCGDYIRKYWPSTGPVFLAAIERALRHPGEDFWETLHVVNPGMMISPQHISILTMI